jgi:hypothetical protein
MKSANFYLKLLFVLAIILGFIEYFKIGRSLVNGTRTKTFISVSPFAINAGEADSLPSEVLAAKKLIDRNSLKTFSLDKKFLNDPLLYQRVIEFSYPARFSKSNYFIGIVNGELKSKCNLIDSDADVGAYVCE